MKALLKPLLLSAALLFGTAPQAAVFEFVTTLSGAAENPPVSTTGTGLAKIFFDDVAQTLDVFVVFSGLLTPTVDAHIHCCIDPTQNTSIAVGFSGAGGFPLGVTAATYQNTFDLTNASIYTAGFLAAGGGTAAGASAHLLTNLLAGLAYVNIHTSGNPKGEIRGQLAVPEPGTLLLLTVAALAAAGMRRRR
jgi:hypothetical protein